MRYTDVHNPQSYCKAEFNCNSLKKYWTKRWKEKTSKRKEENESLQTRKSIGKV